MDTAKEILSWMAFDAFVVLMLPAVLLGLVGYVLWLAFGPERNPKQTDIFDGYEG